MDLTFARPAAARRLLSTTSPLAVPSLEWRGFAGQCLAGSAGNPLTAALFGKGGADRARGDRLVASDPTGCYAFWEAGVGLRKSPADTRRTLIARRYRCLAGQGAKRFSRAWARSWSWLPPAQAADELKVGDKAPAFSLKGSDGKTYTLEQFKGKSAVVIAWFPKAFTGGCTKECKSLRENSKALQELKVAYFTASVDTPEENKKFAESLDLDYPILSDPDKTVAKDYGVLNKARGICQSLDVLHRQGRDHQGDRQGGQGRRTPGPDVAAKVKESGLSARIDVSPRGWTDRCSSGCRCRASSSAQRHLSSPRIRQNSRLCIRP